MPNTMEAIAEKRRPPNAGIGRIKGVPNRTTVVMKEAILHVYADLQKTVRHPSGHGHFFKWAKSHPTDFYRLASKLIPLQVEANVGLIGMPVIVLGVADD